MPMRTGLSGRPATSSMTKPTSRNSTVEPKSGWSISSPATSAVRATQISITGIFSSRNFHERIQARQIAKAGFRNSDGWMVMPSFSQRLAPLIRPDHRHQHQGHQHRATQHDPRRRACSRFSREQASMAISPTA
jgi:hypothetical protein